jgi:hypothetical protein
MRAPRKFKVASGMVLNNMAFGTREESFGMIRRHMTVRSEPFLKRSIIVNKANFNAPLRSQKSEVGSIERPRFTGWIEQETGKRTKRKRAFLMTARRGSKKKKAMPSARLKPSFRPMRPEDMGQQSGNIRGFHHRAQVLLMWTYRNKWRKPFIVRGHKKIKPGLYKWKGSKLQKLQIFRPRKAQPRKFMWLTMARNRYLFKTDMGKEWSKVIDRLFK